MALCGLSLDVVWELLIAAASLAMEHRLWGTQAQLLWHMGLVASQQLRDSIECPQTQDQTRVPCIGRWILNHWTTREVLQSHLKVKNLALYFSSLIGIVDSGLNLLECGWGLGILWKIFSFFSLKLLLKNPSLLPPPSGSSFSVASLSEGQWFRGLSFMQRSCLISTLLWSGLCLLSPGIGKLVKNQALKIFRPLGIGWMMVSPRIYSFATCLLLLRYCDW